jgi:transposase
MRGRQERTGSLFSYVSVEDRIPATHPLRRIRKLADQALDRLNPTFCKLYASEGRPSVPPEQLLLASLLQAFYGIRSERLLLEQLHYNLLFRWYGFAGPAATWVSARMIRSGIRRRSPRTASGCSMSR